MNEKEAREIVREKLDLKPDFKLADIHIKDEILNSLEGCIGYLEALDKAKGLEEALENFLIGYDLGQFTIAYKNPPNTGIVPMFKEVLSEWRKVK